MTREKVRLLTIVSVIAVAIDQLTKWWVVRHFGNVEGRGETIIPGLFDLILTRNPGAAWGMLGNLQPDSLRVGVFVAISIGAVATVLWLARSARPDQRIFLWALSLVLAGAIGNLIDRITVGRVVDFLDFYTRAEWMVSRFGCSRAFGCHWPAFNVADICISIGAGLLLLESLLPKRAERAEVLEAPEAKPAGPSPDAGGSP